MRIAQLQEVFPGVGVLDPRIREVLHPQHDFVLAVVTKLTTDTEVIAKIEFSTELLMVRLVQRNDVICADPDFSKPAITAA